MSSQTATIPHDPFMARSTLTTAHGETVTWYRLPALEEQGLATLGKLPYTVRILLENALRNAGGEFVSRRDVENLAGWRPGLAAEVGGGDDAIELPFLPARVVLQDFTGVPCVVDLAAMRSAVDRLGGDVSRINPLVPVDLVIDHSVQVDSFGTTLALARNKDLEYERNGERYALLRWAQQSFQNFRVVPPGTGIVHQVNLEYLATVVSTREIDGETVAMPDTLVGTDSHTTMINGLGVLGWGVGGIEAEAVMLGQPLYQLTPEVIGVRLTGQLLEGATATDLVLTVTEMLRKYGVVGRFVEFCGVGLSSLSLADRATIANMAPEYGATSALFPVDDETLRYLRLTGRDDRADLVEQYCKAQGLFRTDATPDPEYDDLLELDLADVRPSLAGPKRPQDRVLLGHVREAFRTAYPAVFPMDDPVVAQDNGPSSSGGPATLTAPRHAGTVPVTLGGVETTLHHGSVAIAAITSCTNTSNPSVMVGAGLLARKAVERGLKVPSYVKTSMAPGSQVVTRYLQNADLLPFLEALGFHVVGYGCTTCIGNSGPLPEPVADAVDANQLVAASVISGNRNFEGRVHPQIRASFLASPPLVVAYALAGSVDLDLVNDPLGHDPDGNPVFLADVWPTQQEISDAIASSLDASIFAEEYGNVFTGDSHWQNIDIPTGQLYEWDSGSTYVQEPPFFEDLSPDGHELVDIEGARVLALLPDSVTTDHISPAGSIAKTSPAAEYLVNSDVRQSQFNSYGSRRGNHEVMMRGTFANIRLRNLLVPDREGNVTRYFPEDRETTIWEAGMRYQEARTPLLIIAGKEYGTGSSRDWAAKGTLLLGVKAVLAESFERIHRSNLVGMGVLPMQFQPGESATSLGLTGEEIFAINGIADNLTPRKLLDVTATSADGRVVTFETIARIDSPVEIRYYRNGGILPTVLLRLLGTEPAA